MRAHALLYTSEQFQRLLADHGVVCSMRDTAGSEARGRDDSEVHQHLPPVGPRIRGLAAEKADHRHRGLLGSRRASLFRWACEYTDRRFSLESTAYTRLSV